MYEKDSTLIQWGPDSAIIHSNHTTPPEHGSQLVTSYFLLHSGFMRLIQYGERRIHLFQSWRGANNRASVEYTRNVIKFYADCGGLPPKLLTLVYPSCCPPVWLSSLSMAALTSPKVAIKAWRFASRLTNPIATSCSISLEYLEGREKSEKECVINRF